MTDAKSIKNVGKLMGAGEENTMKEDAKDFSMHKLWSVLMNKEGSNLNFWEVKLEA